MATPVAGHTISSWGAADDDGCEDGALPPPQPLLLATQYSGDFRDATVRATEAALRFAEAQQPDSKQSGPADKT